MRAEPRAETADGFLSTPDSFPSRLAVGSAAFLALTLLSAAATWPLLALRGARVAGDALDPWQTIWGFWWWRHHAELGSSLFFSNVLWWPSGVPMWFQTWDIPSATAAFLAPSWISEVVLYNALVFIAFPLSGWTFCLLCRELWGGRLAPFLAGVLFTFSTYHFAHAQMQLHLASMEWSPLYFLGLVRMTGRGRIRDSVLAGLGLALATMASVYHLMFCAIGTLVMAVFGSFGDRGRLLSRRMLGLVAASVVAYVLAVGWLVAGMAHEYLAEPYMRIHDPVIFSADVQSFFLPNAVSVWSGVFPAWNHWTGNSWESCSYIGYTALGLALVAGVFNRATRAFLWLALLGAILALGPYPHVGGVIYENLALPQAWLVRLLPPLGFSGLPVRFSWLTTFVISVAAGSTLVGLCRRGRAGRIVAIALTALALIETWPQRFLATERSEPEIFAAWARDSGHWAVLDGTSLSSALWHQMHHRHPIIAGYTTRFPRRVFEATNTDPVAAAFLPNPFGDGRMVELPAADGQADLQRLGVRFVVVDDDRTKNAVALQLIERYHGGGIVVYEVPPA
jgi:hypothetical protein